MPRQIDIPCDELGAAYLAGVGTPALARRYGCTPTTIAKRLRAAGITLRDARFTSIAVAEGTLRRLYLDERLPIAAIAVTLGVSASTIGNKRRAYGIPIRPRRVAIALEGATQPAPAEREPRRRRLRETRAVYRYSAAFA
jgi:hypothetical protein